MLETNESKINGQWFKVARKIQRKQPRDLYSFRLPVSVASYYATMDGNLTATFSWSQHAAKNLTHGDLLSYWTVFKVLDSITKLSLGKMSICFAVIHYSLVFL